MKQLQAAAELQHVAELASNHFLMIIFIKRDTSSEITFHRGSKIDPLYQFGHNEYCLFFQRVMLI